MVLKSFQAMFWPELFWSYVSS